MSQLWSVQEVANYLGVPANTLYQWRTKGYGPGRAPHRQVRPLPPRGRRRLDQRAGECVMARVWLYDRANKKKHRDAVVAAKAGKRKPPARWEVMYYDRTGKLRSEVAATKSAAEKRRADIEASLAEGTYVDPALARNTFGSVAERWIETRHDLRSATWWKYRGLLDKHVLFQWGDMPLNAITREDVALWVARLVKSEKDGGAGLGPSQARHAYRVLTMVLEWCVPERLIRNPARGVKLPVRPEAEHIYLTFGQVEALADAAHGLRTKYAKPTASASVNRALILLLAYTGLRWGEAAALRVGRLNLTERRIRVTTTFYEVNGVQQEGPPKTGKSRTVPIPASLVPELRHVVGERGSDELVFRTARSKSLRAHNWRMREFNPAVTTAGLGVPGLTPHKLRHTGGVAGDRGWG